MTIWIVKKHPPYPYGPSHMEAFTIFKTCRTKQEADDVAKEKNGRHTSHFYSVGRVTLKDAP